MTIEEMQNVLYAFVVGWMVARHNAYHQRPFWKGLVVAVVTVVAVNLAARTVVWIFA